MVQANTSQSIATGPAQATVLTDASGNYDIARIGLGANNVPASFSITATSPGSI